MYSRRSILKSISAGAGALSLAPFGLNAFEKKNGTPQRFVFVVKSNGLRPYGIQPKGMEDIPHDNNVKKYSETALKNLKLNSSMKDLEPLKNYISIFQGLSSRTVAASHDFAYGALNASKSPYSRPLKATVDGELAKLLPAAFPHVGFDLNPGKLISYPNISAAGMDKTLPFFASPLQAFSTLFGLVSDDPEVKKQVALKKQLLNFLASDIKKGQNGIPQSEKEKLEHYLNGFNALTERHKRMAALKDLKKYCPKYSKKYSSNIETDIIASQFEMGTAAMQAGLTNVLTFSIDHLQYRYTGLNQKFNVHSIGHMEENGATGSGEDVGTKEEGISLGKKYRHEIREFHFEQIAKMALALKNTPEGKGNMLDNTLIVYLSKSGAQHHPRKRHQFPIVTIGNLNGKLDTGKLFQYPNPAEASHRTLANFYTTLLEVAGKKVPLFGDKDPGLDPKKQEGCLKEWIG